MVLVVILSVIFILLINFYSQTAAFFFFITALIFSLKNWINYLTSLFLSFLLFKIGIIVSIS